MDPPTILAVMNLQIQDIEDLLESPTITAYERATFESMRIGLLSEVAEINDRAAAFRLLVEENANHRTFQRLTNEEAQTQDDHNIAIRLEGSPVPAPSPLAAIDPAHVTLPRKSSTPATPVHHVLTLDATASPAPTQHNTDQPVPTPELDAPQELALEPSADIADSTDLVNPFIEDDQTIPSFEQPEQESPMQDTEEREVEATETQNEPPNTPETSDSEESPFDTDLIFESKKRAPIAMAHKLGLSPGNEPPPSLKEIWEKRFASLQSKPRSEIGDAESTATASGSGDIKRRHLGKSNSNVLTTDGPTGKLPDPQATCVSCYGSFANSEALQLNCKANSETECHAYCQECLTGIYKAALSEPSLFPPRCCSEPISPSTALPLLPPEIREQFLLQIAELGTPNKTYCSDPACAQWIRPRSIEAGVATCQGCQKRTCAVCKKEQHEGLCPKDRDVKRLMKFVRKRKWQTCPSCKNVVELSVGCYHMT
jgi:hypothetical protein